MSSAISRPHPGSRAVPSRTVKSAIPHASASGTRLAEEAAGDAAALRGATAHGRSAREPTQPHRRTLMMRVLSTLILIASTLLAPAAPARAQSRQETLIVIVESGPNSMDIHGVGANRPAYQASWNLYDRLLTYGVKRLPDGSRMYDYNSLKPEAGDSSTFPADGTQ